MKYCPLPSTQERPNGGLGHKETQKAHRAQNEHHHELFDWQSASHGSKVNHGALAEGEKICNYQNDVIYPPKCSVRMRRNEEAEQIGAK